MSEHRPDTAHTSPLAGIGKGWKAVGLVLLAAAMALGFAGHLSADMKLQWETLMALCGF